MTSVEVLVASCRDVATFWEELSNLSARRGHATLALVSQKLCFRFFF